MDYFLMFFRDFLSGLFNLMSTINIVDGVSLVSVLIALFLLGVLFNRYGIR